MAAQHVHIVDSHTAGEPTRVVIAGGPPLGNGNLAERLERFRNEHDRFRSAVVNEPRGSDAMVGGLITEPSDPACAAGVIFFNNTGYLGMCGHGTIGVAVTLAHLGRIGTGVHAIETPVGIVDAEVHDANSVTVANVASYRLHKSVTVTTDGFGEVTGDVAWGGNWFFLSEHCPFAFDLSQLDELTRYAWSIRRALRKAGIAGASGQEIDHVELFGPPRTPGTHSRNFVLCPGGSYDRSPCGTGTSAKLACLYGDGKLREGDVWKQESITGSLFEGSVIVRDGMVYPRITGSAFITAESCLLFDEHDPFCWGIPAR